MFGLFKKRRSVASADDLRKLTASARDDVKVKWIQFNKTVHLKEGTPLSRRIDAFAEPIQQFFETKYPALLLGSSEIFWLTIFTAVLESGTHPKSDVNAAIADLKLKYARR